MRISDWSSDVCSSDLNIKEQAFHQACENDQGFKQCLIVFRRAGPEVLIGNRVDERDQKFIFGAYRRNLVVGVEDFRFIQIQAFDDVLIGDRKSVESGKSV